MPSADSTSALDDAALLDRAAAEAEHTRRRAPAVAAAGVALAALGGGLGWALARPHTSGWAFFLFLLFGVVPATALVDRLFRLAGGKGPGCGALALAAALLDVAAAVLLSQTRAGALDAAAGALALGLGGAGLLGAALVGRPGMAARRELRRRFWGPGDAEAAARRALADEDGPDRVLLLEARALPHGGWRWVRLELWLGARPRGRVEARLAPFEPRRDLLPGYRRGAAPLVDLDVAALASLTAGDALPQPESHVRDGLPCDLRVLRRGQPDLRASFNLAGLSEADRALPAARLAALLLELGERAAAPPPTPPRAGRGAA